MTKKTRARNTVALAGTLLSLIVAAASASAQPSSRPNTLTGFAGAHLFDLGGEFEEHGTELETALDFGGRFQLDVTERWAIEFGIVFSPGAATLRDAGGREVDVNALYFTVGVVLKFPTESRRQPYVTGGVGAATLDVGNGGGSDSSLTLSFGGGIVYQLGHGLAIRVEARDYVSYTGSISPASLDALQLPSEFEEIVNDLSLTAGLSFSF
jgi:opacity protein-like surface antigen